MGTAGSSGGDERLSIGEVASRAGVAAHVLRHWEAEGLLTPLRTASGHRVCDQEHQPQIRLIQRGQAGGLSLAKLGRILHEHGHGRRRLLEAHREQLRLRAAQVSAALNVVEHPLECSHPSLTVCAGCRAALETPVSGKATAAPSRPLRSGRSRNVPDADARRRVRSAE